jgi:cytochrome c oxidase assembly protein subunit 15
VRVVRWRREIALNRRHFSVASLWTGRLVVLLVLSGGAVRLTDSGLGCPDWPACTSRSVVPPDSFHPLVEFANRVLNGVGIGAVLGLALGSLFLRPRSKKVIVASFCLAGTIVAQALVGAAVVYSHLYPPVVALHFLLTMAMLAMAVVLHHETSPQGSAPAQPGVRTRADLCMLLLAIALFSGTLATGAGPHGGDPHAARLPLSFFEAVTIHAVSTALLGAVLGMVVLDVLGEEGVRTWALLAGGSFLAQATVGMVQFALKVPAALVELHLFFACALTSALVKLRLIAAGHATAPAEKEGVPVRHELEVVG